jgi:AraC-like DNA-binding protein
VAVNIAAMPRRILLVKRVAREKPLKLQVDGVGYASESALSRSFKAQVGAAPAGASFQREKA